MPAKASLGIGIDVQDEGLQKLMESIGKLISLAGGSLPQAFEAAQKRVQDAERKTTQVTVEESEKRKSKKTADAKSEEQIQEQANKAVADSAQRYAKLKAEYEGRSLDDIRAKIHAFEQETRVLRQARSHEEEAAVKKEIQERTNAVNTELQLYRSLEKEKMGARTFSEQLEKGSSKNISMLMGGLKDQLSGVMQTAQSSAGPLSGVLGIVGKMGPIGMAAAAGVGALTFGITKSIQIGQEFEDSLADLRAITGLTAQDTDMLGQKARKMAVDFGMTAKGGVEAFKLVISALGPDIAKDQDALNEMGRDVTTLAKASGLEAKDAVDSLTTTMNQFGFGTLPAKQQAGEMTRIMNVMAAGAKEGAAEVPDLAESMKIVGTVAKQSGISVEGTVGAIEALSQAGIKGGEAGTGFRNVLLGMSTGSKEAQKALQAMGITFDDINPAKVGLTQGLNTLKAHLGEVHDAGSRSAIMMALFGKENAAAANVLVQSGDAVDDFTKKITGTNEAQNQAAIKMDTFSEKMKKVGSKLEDIALSVYKLLQPALKVLADGLSTGIDWLMKIAGVIGDVIGFVMKLQFWLYEKLYLYAIKPVFDFIAKLIKQGYEWVTSLTFVQNIVATVKAGISGLVEWVMKAYNTVTDFLTTIGILEKKAEKPVTVEVQAKVTLPPDEKVDNAEGGPKFMRGQRGGGGGAGKSDKDKAYEDEKKKEETRYKQDKLDLERQLASKLLTQEEYNAKLETVESTHVTNLKDIVDKHRKGHEQDAIDAESAFLKIKIAANAKEVAEEKKKQDELAKEQEKADKLREKREKVIADIQREALKTQIAAIKDADEKAIAEENARYEAELDAREEDLMDIKTGKLVAEALETNHQNKLNAIAEAGAAKRAAAQEKELRFFAGPFLQGMQAGLGKLFSGVHGLTKSWTDSNNVLKNIFGNILNNFISMVEQMVAKVIENAAIFALTSLFTGGGAGVASILTGVLGLAEGAVVNRPTLLGAGVMTKPTYLASGGIMPFIGGEAGPEAAIPLTRYRGMNDIMDGGIKDALHELIGVSRQTNHAVRNIPTTAVIPPYSSKVWQQQGTRTVNIRKIGA